MEELQLIYLEIEEKMEKAIEQYNGNLVKISAGRANPQILNGIKVEYYEQLTPIPQLANISVPEPNQLVIKPYEMILVKSIVGTINSSSLGFTAIDEGDKVRITFPLLTTERRKELVKSFGNYTEQAKVSIRTVRQEGNKWIKTLDLSEDDEKKQLNDMQQLTDDFIEKISKRAKEKEKELMTI